MSNGWSWYIIVLAVGNIIGMIWLLFATSRSNDQDENSTTGHTWDGIEELNKPLPRWWLGLFIITIIFAGVYLYLYPGLGKYEGSLKWTQLNQFEKAKQENTQKQQIFLAEFADMSAQELSSNSKAMETAGRLFSNNCAVCHGSDAGGAKGFPNLTDDDWLYGGDAATITQTITHGRQGAMPNLGLPIEKVRILTNYVLSLSGHEASDYSVSKGKQLFAVCAACHGVDGKGNKAVGAPNLTDDIWLHGGSVADIQNVLLHGKQGNMLSFKEVLSPLEIRLLTGYVLSLSSR